MGSILAAGSQTRYGSLCGNALRRIVIAAGTAIASWTACGQAGLDSGISSPNEQGAASGLSAASSDPTPAGASLVRDPASRNIARVAFADLALQERTTPGDHRLAGALLSVAYDLSPSVELLRWRLGAASSAGDADLEFDLIRRLLREDPKDTVLQLRFIGRSLDQSQTIEDRIASLRRLTGAQGASLDPSVRSRLAMEMAALLQERGDEPGFVEALKLAGSLDSTNRDAAAAALAYFAERVDDPIGRLELLGNLLLAEPTDPETHLAIARELAALGAFDEAQRFQDIVSRILEQSGVAVPPALARERLFTRWGAEGAQTTVDELESQIKTYRVMTERRIKELEEALVSTAGIPRPEEVRLEPITERVRLISAVVSGRNESADLSAADMRATVATRLAELADPRQRQEGVTEAQAEEYSVLMRLGMIESLCWAGRDADGAALELDDVIASSDLSVDDPDLQTARGWALLRWGDLAGANEALSAVRDSRAVAELGMAELHTQVGDTDAAIESLTRVWKSVPLTLEGMYAHSRLVSMLGLAEVDPAMLERARRFSQSVPASIDAMAQGGQAFMNLTVQVSPQAIDALGASVLRITLRNSSGMPLGMGPDRAINSQMLIGSSVEVGQASVKAHLRPEVASTARRLRLMPNETIEIAYLPDAGSAGWVIDQNCDRLVRQRWRVIQGFEQDTEGAFIPGALCLSRETQSQIRGSLRESTIPTGELVAKIAAAPEADLVPIAMLLRSRLLNPSDDSTKVSGPDIDAAASALAARYPSLSVDARAMLVSIIPQATLVEGLSAFDEVVKREADPMISVVILVTRIVAADDPFLSACAASSDPRLSSTATALRERYASGLEGFAALGGPNVGEMMKAAGGGLDALRVGEGSGK
jgi:hypothetical protein